MPRSKRNKKNTMSVYYILDGSGSMEPVQNDVVGGVNGFIEEQKKVNPNGRFSLTVFDTRITKPYESVKISEVQPIDRSISFLGGMTALLDAVGKTVTDAEKDEGKKLVVIYTDGFENASREYTNESIKKLIDRLTDKGDWTFTFVSADTDNLAQAQAMGVPGGNYLKVSSADTKGTMSRLSNASVAYAGSSLRATNSFVEDFYEPTKGVASDLGLWVPPEKKKRSKIRK